MHSAGQGGRCFLGCHGPASVGYKDLGRFHSCLNVSWFLLSIQESGLEHWDYSHLCESVFLVGLLFHKFSELVHETMKTFAPVASYSLENFISTSFFLFILEKASPSLGLNPGGD